MPKDIVNSCVLDPAYQWEFTIQRPDSSHLLQSVLTFQLPPVATYSPAVTWEAQASLTVNWQGIQSRSFQGTHRCSGKAEECPGLTTITTSESKVKKSFTCGEPFPPHRPHPASLEVNSPQCAVSQMWVLWLRLSWCHSRKQWGHPLHQRKRHLTEIGPPFSPLGSLAFPGHRKQTSSSEGICFQCGKKRERDPERFLRACPWLKAHNQGNFCPFPKGESIKKSSGSAADPSHRTYTKKNSVLTQQSKLCQVTFHCPFSWALGSHKS